MHEKLYITEKEAVTRYGYSRASFQNWRWKGGSPPYIKINNGGVRYPIKECDAWFANHGLRTSTSANPEGVQNVVD